MAERLPVSDPAVQQALGRTRRSKYNARRTEVDGIMFDSAKEAKRYSDLRLLEKAGEIRGLVVQPRFLLHVSRSGACVLMETVLGSYVADFSYVDREDHTVIEDVKGVRTPLYVWKKKHVEAQYGIHIREL